MNLVNWKVCTSQMPAEWSFLAIVNSRHVYRLMPDKSYVSERLQDHTRVHIQLSKLFMSAGNHKVALYTELSKGVTQLVHLWLISHHQQKR